MMTNEKKTCLEVNRISKSFPGVKALDEVDFSIQNGEVHALVGENGAGKSTLMKILAGIYTPDEGEIVYRGNTVSFRNPFQAIEDGIILIHQELSLVQELTVAENIFLGQLPLKQFGRVDWKKLYDRTKRILEQLKCDFEPTDLVNTLSIAYQQMVEIGRALSREAQMIIFDEPTASLTDSEVDVLFENIIELKKKGAAIVYITHKMDEIFKISDRITVLRDGRKTGTLITSETNRNEMINLMIGRELKEFFHTISKDIGKEVLRVEKLCREKFVKDVSFEIKSGEVLGLYGLVGAGRSETAESIFGIVQADSGKIFLEGEEVKVPNPKKAVGLGLGLVPENRKLQGLILGMACDDNLTLPRLDKMQTLGFINNSVQNSLFREYAEKLSISTPGPKQPVGKLSGGNQQKIVIGKWISLNPKLLILDEPTRGIDVGSKSEIHRLIGQMAAEGIAVLVISSEMPEIIGVSDRIITMREGQVTDEFGKEEVTEKKLIRACAQR
jgi:ribose transport system ATP-binding protein